MTRVLPEAPRPAADYFCRHRRSGYRSWDASGGWRSPEAPRKQQRRANSDRTSEQSRDLVGARVVCEARRDEKLGLRRPCDFLRGRGWSTLLGAIGPRAAAAPVAPPLGNGGISSLKQSAVRLNLAWLASVSGTCHVELNKLPKSNPTNSKRSP